MEEYYTAGTQKFLLKYETDTTPEAFYERYAELYKSCFGPREYVSPQWFNWFNHESPFGKSNIYTVTDCETDLLVGAYTLLHYKARYGTDFITVPLCCNVMTHPEYGGKGLFTKIGEFALNHSITHNAIALGIPNENAIKGHMKVGWQEMPDLYFVQKDRDQFRAFENNALISEDLNVLKSFNFDSFNSRYSFAILRSFEFIQWRYINKATAKYSSCYLSENGSIKGFAIFKVYEDTHHGQKKVHIVDYCITDQDTFSTILKQIETYALASQVDLINLWDLTAEHSADYKTLQQENYRVSSSFNRLILYSTEKIDTSDMANWHIVLGDNDVY